MEIRKQAVLEIEMGRYKLKQYANFLQKWPWNIWVDLLPRIEYLILKLLNN